MDVSFEGTLSCWLKGNQRETTQFGAGGGPYLRRSTGLRIHQRLAIYLSVKTMHNEPPSPPSPPLLLIGVLLGEIDGPGR